MSALALFGWASAALLTLFALAFWISRRVDNYGIVDVVWSAAFMALIVFYASAGSGWAPRRWLLAAMVGAWSLRLASHLGIRVLGHLDQEDRRYRQLRTDWAVGFERKMLLFFLLQGLSVAVLGLGFLPPMSNARTDFHALELAGAAVWLIALIGESVADRQLAAFKRDPANRGGICMTGLWRVSRHPNYFFEALAWTAWLLFALPSPGGWIAIIGPAGILWLLLRVTGIPMAEQQSLQRHGDAYRRYQETTSAFVPWFPRKRPPAASA